MSEKASLHDNLIVHGDNLAALKALLPTYHSKVKRIYIDPPYNTGKEGWAYNDKVNSPLMQDWLGRVVDRDDLTRHDKWCCMMLPRLKLLRQLLREDGVIFASIDDNEVHHLRCLMDEVFGEHNRVGKYPGTRYRRRPALQRRASNTDGRSAVPVQQGPHRKTENPIPLRQCSRRHLHFSAATGFGNMDGLETDTDQWDRASAHASGRYPHGLAGAVHHAAVVDDQVRDTWDSRWGIRNTWNARQCYALWVPADAARDGGGGETR